MRGDRNFKGSDSSDPSVYFLFCATIKLEINIHIRAAYKDQYTHVFSPEVVECSALRRRLYTCQTKPNMGTKILRGLLVLVLCEFWSQSKLHVEGL